MNFSQHYVTKIHDEIDERQHESAPAPYDAKINVGCLSLASEMNGANIRLRMTLKINVGCVCL